MSPMSDAGAAGEGRPSGARCWGDTWELCQDVELNPEENQAESNWSQELLHEGEKEMGGFFFLIMILW